MRSTPPWDISVCLFFAGLKPRNIQPLDWEVVKSNPNKAIFPENGRDETPLQEFEFMEKATEILVWAAADTWADHPLLLFLEVPLSLVAGRAQCLGLPKMKGSQECTCIHLPCDGNHA